MDMEWIFKLPDTTPEQRRTFVGLELMEQASNALTEPALPHQERHDAANGPHSEASETGSGARR